MRDRTVIQSIRWRFRRHQRLLFVLYWVAVVLLAIPFVVPKLRTTLHFQMEHVARHWDDRWGRRVEYGERLVDSEQYDQAIDYLSRLDLAFPARTIQHKRDKQRERILDALGRSYAALGRKKLALSTYRRLAAFEPRNYVNHHHLAVTCDQFTESQEARKHVRRVLSMHPTHLPSVRREIEHFIDSGDFESVVNTYRSYLDAFLIHYISVSLGDGSVNVAVPVDGHFHELEVQLPRPADWSGPLAIGTSGVSIEVDRVDLRPPIIIGRTTAHASASVPVPGAWSREDFETDGTDLYRAAGPESVLTLQVSSQPHGVAAVRLRVRLFKAHDEDVWQMVESSYRSRVDPKGLAAARDRSPVKRQPDT